MEGGRDFTSATQVPEEGSDILDLFLCVARNFVWAFSSVEEI